MLDYYTRIGEAMVPHLAHRCLTFRRYPDGTHVEGFFAKRCPDHRPGWVPVSPGPSDRRGGIDYCRIEEPAALVWAANLAAIELHAPMSYATSQDTPRTLVFDFDPGPGTDIHDCSVIALRVREILASVGMEGLCKTSGSKGMQLYVPLNCGAPTHEDTARFARAIGALLAKQTPELVTTVMAKAERPGKIFVDWSQNAFHKTTVAPYSLRARPTPTVSAPVSWDEVERCAARETELSFDAAAVLARVNAFGDLFERVLTERQELPLR